MKSIKIHEDTLAAIRAAKVRNGGTYDDAINTILKKQAAVIEPMLACAAQLDRIEVILSELKDQLSSQPGAFIKSGGAFVIE
jgi:hypothetical protein